ncbi:MAG: GlxA family transcriptional regulator, partial [Halieaceae bacterium]|nr:GlxA family transcriptional regulator [Halieaceae bacterium]
MYDSTVKGASQTPYRVGFLLVNEFTLISLSSAVAPLRVANQLAGRELYSWELLGEGPATQSCSDGFAVNLDKTLSDSTDYDLVIVVGGLAIEQNVARPILAWLRKQAQRGVLVGSVCT